MLGRLLICFVTPLAQAGERGNKLCRPSDGSQINALASFALLVTDGQTNLHTRSITNHYDVRPSVDGFLGYVKAESQRINAVSVTRFVDSTSSSGGFLKDKRHQKT
jgi:hypothetical protein